MPREDAMRETTYVLLRIEHNDGEGLTSALECIVAGARQSTDDCGDPLPSLQCSGGLGRDAERDVAQWDTVVSIDPEDIAVAASVWGTR